LVDTHNLAEEFIGRRCVMLTAFQVAEIVKGGKKTHRNVNSGFEFI
jgi:hypothetical protein